MRAEYLAPWDMCSTHAQAGRFARNAWSTMRFFPVLRTLNFLIKKLSEILFLLRWSSHVWSKSSLGFKDIVFWDVLDRYWRFGWEFCVLLQGRVYAEDGDSMFLRNFVNDLRLHDVILQEITVAIITDVRIMSHNSIFFCCGLNSVALSPHVGVRGAVLTHRDKFRV